jgi:predicted amidohydrolase/predicted O-methyltransferase YrrM
MQVYLVQLDSAWEDKAASFARTQRLLDAANISPGSLIVLPEMFATGFSMNPAIWENQRGDTFAFLAREAQQRKCHIVAGVATFGMQGKGQNESLVVGPDGNEVDRYCKMQPFTLGGERDCFHIGEQPRMFAWNDWRVGHFVCYDLRFPEVFRPLAREGVELITVIANWPAAREEHWLALLTARAIENQCYVVGVNRCGSDPKLSYVGHSMIVAPSGKTIARAGEGEEVLAADLDLEELRAYRRKLPFLGDLRQDFVQGYAPEGGERGVWSRVDEFFESTVVASDGVLEASIERAEQENLPPIQVTAAQGKLLMLLAKSMSANRILEIGTLGGYSTIWMARALPKGGRLVTLEAVPKHADVARANLAQAGLTDVVDLRVGLALETLAVLEQENAGPFDLIFIDADKANNPHYFEWAIRLGRVGSMIVVDNVVRDGQVANAESKSADVAATRQLFSQLAADPRVQATGIQTVGGKGYDGFLLALVISKAM